MGNSSFTQWLSAEVEERGWTFGELGRRANLSSGMMSKVMTESALPSWNFCLKTSRALQMPAEDVFRIAGLLPSLPPEVAEEREAISILRSLSTRMRQAAMTMLRALAREEGAPVGGSDPPAAYTLEDDAFVRELLEEFRQVPDEWKEVAIQEFRRVRRFSELPTTRFVGEDNEEERITEES